MADHVVTLLRDDARRIRLAESGRELVRRFDWDTSSRALEAFLHAYGADPDRYRAPVAG
jgi:hypothetical protein